MGVDEQIGIDQDRLKDSPSATARISAMLSTLAVRHAPRFTERV